VAGLFIDLAIRNPKKPGAFLLGIECDGATYHSSKSAHDRDRFDRSDPLVPGPDGQNFSRNRLKPDRAGQSQRLVVEEQLGSKNRRFLV
jgi:REase_MTES_1575